jgi:hypothetical protein
VPVALSATEIDALTVPGATGLKVTMTVHEAPAARDVPQLLVCPKLLELVPKTEMLLMLSAAVPPLVSVIGRAVDNEPTVVVPGNVSGLGEREA